MNQKSSPSSRGSPGIQGFPAEAEPRQVDFFFPEWPRLMTPGGSRGYGLNGLNHGYQMLLWMEEILPQLVDGLSHYDPIIYSVS